jgi:hypothetical protein
LPADGRSGNKNARFKQFSRNALAAAAVVRMKKFIKLVVINVQWRQRPVINSARECVLHDCDSREPPYLTNEFI